MRRVAAACVLFLAAFPFWARAPLTKGKFDLLLNGVNKGYEKFKIEEKKGERTLSSEIRFQMPMPKAKRNYIDLYLYPVLSLDAATGSFQGYSYRLTFNDFSKTDLVEAQDSAREVIDQDWRSYDLFNRSAQLQQDEMANRIDLGVNSGKVFPGEKVLHFQQTRFSDSRIKDEPMPERPFVVDSYTFVPYLVLAQEAAAMKEPSRPLTLIFPQALSVRAGSLEYMGTDRAPFRGKTLILKHFDLLIGTTLLSSFWLDRKGEVALVTIPGEGLVALRADYTPEPFDQEAPRIVSRSVEVGGGFKEEKVRVAASGVTLGGTLALPQGQGPFPAVLLVQDLAALDRDGNDPRDPYSLSGTWKQLAALLAENGVASLRYDSRGVGESGGDPQKVSPEDRIADARALADYLASRPEAKGGKVVVLGVGLGAWMAARAAAVSPSVSAFVGVAYPAKPLLRLWKEQVGSMTDPEARQKAYLELSALEVQVEKGTEPEFTFRGQRLHMPAVRTLAAMDPLEMARALAVPCLFAYPERDLTVQAFHADILSPALHGGQEVLTLPGVGHTLAAQNAEGEGSGLVDGAAVKTLARWITAHAAPEKP